MPIEGEYEPSPSPFVRDQVETYERTGGREGNRLPPGDSGWPVIILTTRGNRSGKVRKTPLMRVEHNGDYAVVASLGGAPKHPVWYHNLKSHPEVVLQDGPEPFDGIARELEGEERAAWWERAIAAYPPYADYQQRTSRQIPVFLIQRI
jgi:deazaflavin-dependent oxidoreductase (nitroreductase family)